MDGGAVPFTGPPARVLRDSTAWFSDGAQRKRQARRLHRCVECGAALASARASYCRRSCQWRFRGRYFWDAARTFVLYRDRYRCQVCHQRRRVRELDVDHIREIAAGGPSLDYANLQTICRPCHRRKTAQFLRARSRLRRSSDTVADLASPVEYWLDWFPS